MELVRLGPEFGVEVRGIGPIDVASSDTVYRSIRTALEEHSVLLFREQEVTDDVQASPSSLINYRLWKRRLNASSHRSSTFGFPLRPQPPLAV
jgi:hypothetical protein